MRRLEAPRVVALEPGLPASVVAVVQVGESFLASVEKALRHHHLSRAGREALAVLEGAGQPLSPTTIAERLIVTTASVTSLLDTLERRGWSNADRTRETGAGGSWRSPTTGWLSSSNSCRKWPRCKPRPWQSSPSHSADSCSSC
jgi:hypothetical protein